jgi:hypothetical protein
MSVVKGEIMHVKKLKKLKNEKNVVLRPVHSKYVPAVLWLDICFASSSRRRPLKGVVTLELF